jgi:hypothetical protein
VEVRHCPRLDQHEGDERWRIETPTDPTTCVAGVESDPYLPAVVSEPSSAVYGDEDSDAGASSSVEVVVVVGPPVVDADVVSGVDRSPSQQPLVLGGENCPAD